MASALTPTAMRGVNTVLLRDGTEVHLDDIATAAQGQAILDELDSAIDAIEGQVAAARDGIGSHDPDWRRRAETALKRKRRMRPRLQQRIGELRKAERQAPAAHKPNCDRPFAQDKRIAFIDAAEAMLDRDLFTEIWARAKTLNPDAFVEGRRS